MSGPLGWVVTRQSWAGRLPGSASKPPPVIRVWFPNRGEAERHKAELRQRNPSRDVLICLTPAAEPRKRSRRAS
jgi:hypothetical protein